MPLTCNQKGRIKKAYSFSKTPIRLSSCNILSFSMRNEQSILQLTNKRVVSGKLSQSEIKETYYIACAFLSFFLAPTNTFAYAIPSSKRHAFQFRLLEENKIVKLTRKHWKCRRGITTDMKELGAVMQTTFKDVRIRWQHQRDQNYNSDRRSIARERVNHYFLFFFNKNRFWFFPRIIDPLCEFYRTFIKPKKQHRQFNKKKQQNKQLIN